MLHQNVWVRSLAQKASYENRTYTIFKLKYNLNYYHAFFSPNCVLWKP